MTTKWFEFLDSLFPGSSAGNANTPGLAQEFAPPVTTATLSLGAQNVPLAIVKNRRARRYILRLRSDGTVRITVPRGGTANEAIQFARRHTAWIEQQLQRLPDLLPRGRPWSAGEFILYQGEWTKLEPIFQDQQLIIGLAEHRISVRDGKANLRPSIEAFLWKRARAMLAPRVWAWETHCQRLGLAMRRSLQKVTVRNQHSRWGSCSARGTVSLNWRLIQMPVFVQDYLILHELVHLREMNHSPRYWQQVTLVCPDYASAEAWIKRHVAQLG